MSEHEKALLIEGDIKLYREKQFNSNIRRKERYLSRIQIPLCFENEEMLIEQINKRAAEYGDNES